MTTDIRSHDPANSARSRHEGDGSHRQNHWWIAELDPHRVRHRRSADETKADDGGTRPEITATTFPSGEPPLETGFSALLRHSKLLFGRQMLVWSRDKKILIQSLIYPALSMIMFKVVLGDAISMVTGVNSAYGTVPLVVLVGAMFGSLAAGVRLRRERRTGLLGRIYVLPVHKAADLTARIGSELVRIFISTIVLTMVGYLIGWRFDQGPLATLGIFVIPLLFGAAFSTIMLAVAVNATNLPLVPLMSLLSSLLLFFNSGFSPIFGYPNWLQPIVRYQPMTCAIDAMRALALGQPAGEYFLLTVLWAVGLITMFAYPAITGFRRAAASRT